MSNWLTPEEGYAALQDAVPAGISQDGQCKIKMTDSWNLVLSDDLDDKIDVWLAVKGQSLMLTQHTLFSLASNFSIPRALLVDTPPSLVQPIFNYWLSVASAEVSPRFIYNDQNVAVDIFKPFSAPPVSAPDLAKQVVNSLATHFNVDESTIRMLPDHVASFREVVFRFVLTDGPSLTIEGDDWLAGVQVNMSPSGAFPGLITMILVRREDSLVVSLPKHEFKHSVKKIGTGLDEYLGWVDNSIGVIQIEADSELMKLAHLIQIDVSDDLDKIMADIFAAVSLPLSLRATVAEAVEAMDGDSGYDLMLCVAEAQFTPDESEGRLEKVRRAAGRMYAVLGSRCTSCHSLLLTHE